jgi:hypothetical protein
VAVLLPGASSKPLRRHNPPMIEATADSLIGSGSATAPAAGAAIATVAIPQSSPAPPGVAPTEFYHVFVNSNQSGTIDTSHPVHLGLYHGTTLVGALLSTGVANLLEIPRVSPGADPDLTLKAIAAFGAGSIVAATIIATRIS